MSEFFSLNQILFVVITAITCLTTIIALTIAIIGMKRTKEMREILDILFAGKKAKDLEEIIIHNNKRIEEFDGEIQELFNISNTIHKQAHKGLNKVGFLRFDPFKDSSGNQSFALALLDSADNGVVISSFHTRDGTRIYAKEVQKGAPTKHELTQEEKDAIAQSH